MLTVAGSLLPGLVPYGTTPFAYYDAARAHWIRLLLASIGSDKSTFRCYLLDWCDPWTQAAVTEIPLPIPVWHASLTAAAGGLWTYALTDRGDVFMQVPDVVVPLGQGLLPELPFKPKATTAAAFKRRKVIYPHIVPPPFPLPGMVAAA